MAAALKVFTRGTLIFFEITIVVFFVASLAAMAAVGCLVARKRNRGPKFQGCSLIDFARTHNAA
jgi:preprotein translocase subunit SecF